MVGKKTIGVLAFQGAFQKHCIKIESLGYTSRHVRTPSELSFCDALIIPGGESTTMQQRLDFIKMEEPLIRFAKEKPIFGTCAGLILMARLGIVDLEVVRNGFGRQRESFSTPLIFNYSHSFRGVFIRAPRIKSCGEGVEVLASLGDEPVIVRQGHHLAATCHPELTESDVIHDYFLKI